MFTAANSHQVLWDETIQEVKLKPSLYVAAPHLLLNGVNIHFTVPFLQIGSNEGILPSSNCTQFRRPTVFPPEFLLELNAYYGQYAFVPENNETLAITPDPDYIRIWHS